MSKDEKAGIWDDRVQDFRSSGQTCREWCAEHQIPVSTMAYWIRKLEKEDAASEVDTEPVFVRLPSEAEIIMRDGFRESAAVSILISDHIRIETAPSCPLELFRILIRTLKENA